MKPLLTPLWMPGEAWSGYLLRLANVNGVNGIRNFSKRTGIAYGDMLLGQPSAVLAMLGITHSDVPHVHLRGGQDAIRTRLHKGLRPLTSAVCPRCLRADRVPHFRARWDYPLEITCHVHDSQLVAECPCCSAPVSIRRTAYLHCECGVPFTDWRAPAAEFRTGTMRQILSVELASNDELTFQPPSAAEIRALCVLRNLAHETRHSGEPQVREHGAVRRISNAIGRQELLRLAVPWFDDWPRGFERKLAASDWSPGYQGALHLTRSALQSTHFRRIDEAVERLKKRRREVRKERNESLLELEPMIPCHIADILAGLPRNTTYKWIRAGSLHGSQRVGRFYCVPRKDVEALREHLDHSISIAEAAQALRLPTSAVIHLRKAGLLRACDLDTRRGVTCRLDPIEVERFGASTLMLAQANTSGTKLRPLGRVIYATATRLGSQSLQHIFAAIRSKRLPVYRQPTLGERLDGLFLPYRELRRCLKEGRGDYTVSA